MAPDIQVKGEKKRIMVMAEYTGPGPAKYNLPTTVGTKETDQTKKGAPSFSFGSRQFRFRPSGPGPAYSLDSDLTHKGRVTGSSFSLGGRPKTPKRRDISPGPAAYNTDRAPLWEKNSPKYSLSPRTSPRRIDVTPSPGAYSLPSTIGPRVPHRNGGPATSIAGKNSYGGFSSDWAKTPGPATYGAYDPGLTKNRGPSYSLGARAKPAPDKDNFPGPGKYSPEKVTVHMENSPRYPIGVRHSQFAMPVMPLADVQ